MAFYIQEAGILSTFQDLGRYGHQSTGISPAGVLDYKSAVLANQLVGNNINEAVIEMNFTGISFDVMKDTVISVVGAEMRIDINGRQYTGGKAIKLAKGDQVKFGKTLNGIRSYLAVAGGFHLKKELGSYSTHLRTAMGGHQGRPLQKGDLIAYNGKSNHTFPYYSNEKVGDTRTIRIITGPNYDDLTIEAKESLTKTPYKITRSSDRMGIRLEGIALKTTDGVHDILSAPTQLGNIQVPKNGQPIILLNDRQTTGGYKRMATVAKIDLPKLVQIPPEEEIYFELIELDNAVSLYKDEMNKLLNNDYLKIDSEHSDYRRITAEKVKTILMR
ncbi:biotin-dependent carboxyltransferase family protein [Aerococcus viridans]|uniref:5-oxoprolinase subunit C family protein n=1 Tax=Aerococcus viridans TaxID=1377 RepID=UPI0028FD1AB5|nr:biotin-dependent carboxyltransferase family protein [Aerococcus viridans]